MSKKRICLLGLALALIAVFSVIVVEEFLKPVYAVKSLIKIISFSSAVGIYFIVSKDKIKKIIYLNMPKKMKPLIISVLFCFAGVFIIFFLLKNQLDLLSIKKSLLDKENLTPKNCIFVFLYIIIFNSFLEEAFFRGLITHLFANRIIGSIVSSLLFSVYHLGIVSSWFNPLVLVLCIVGLALVGVFLQWLCESRGSIVGSWVVHSSANVAINIIGALLIFGIIE